LKLYLPVIYRNRRNNQWACTPIEINVEEVEDSSAPIAMRLTNQEEAYNQIIEYRQYDKHLYMESRWSRLTKHLNWITTPEEAMKMGTTQRSVRAASHPWYEYSTRTDVYGLGRKSEALWDTPLEEVEATPMGRIIRSMEKNVISINGVFHTRTPGPIYNLTWYDKRVRLTTMDSTPYGSSLLWSLKDLEPMQEFISKIRGARILDYHIEHFLPFEAFEPTGRSLEKMAYSMIYAIGKTHLKSLPRQHTETYLEIVEAFRKGWEGTIQTNEPVPSWPYLPFNEESFCAADLLPLMPKLKTLIQRVDHKVAVKLIQQKNHLIKDESLPAPDIVKDLAGFVL